MNRDEQLRRALAIIERMTPGEVRELKDWLDALPERDEPSQCTCRVQGTGSDPNCPACIIR